MKKILIAVILIAGLTAVAFATLNKKKDVKQVEKKECVKKCMFS